MLNITTVLVEFPPLLQIDPNDDTKLQGLFSATITELHRRARIM